MQTKISEITKHSNACLVKSEVCGGVYSSKNNFDLRMKGKNNDNIRAEKGGIVKPSKSISDNEKARKLKSLF